MVQRETARRCSIEREYHARRGETSRREVLPVHGTLGIVTAQVAEAPRHAESGRALQRTVVSVDQEEVRYVLEPFVNDDWLIEG